MGTYYIYTYTFIYMGVETTCYITIPALRLAATSGE